MKNIAFDSNDKKGMLEIMKKYGDEQFPFFGKNEDDEDVMISVAHDSIVVKTFQDNGWTRENWYELIDGDIVVSEMYGERWK